MTFRGGGFLYRNEMASRRLSQASVETEVDASPMDEDVLGVGIGCVLFVEVVGFVGVVLLGAVTDMMRGWVTGTMGELWVEWLAEGAALLYRGSL